MKDPMLKRAEATKKMTIETISYLSPDGTLSPECKHTIPDDVLVRGLQVMMTTNAVDERMITLQRQGTITFALSSEGEEACAVATAAALEKGDWLYPQYREDGVMFWRGYSIQDYIHHMFSNGNDSILGRQMPNHFGSRDLNVVTVSSPLATQIPHAAGAAYAMLLKKDPHITLAFFGEGTTSKGDFHNGLNFAAVKKTPTIFFCRNNRYAISTRTEDQFATAGIAERGPGYGITAYRCDGNDFFAVHETVSNARHHCLEGKGPVLIEAMTYRLGAHSTSDDPSAYRSQEEEKEWEEKEPIRRLRRYLEQRKLWDEQKDEAYRQQLKKELDAAIDIAKKTPPPPLDSLTSDVYFETPPKLRKQQEELNKFYGEEG